MSASRRRFVSLLLCGALLTSAPSLFAESESAHAAQLRPSTPYLQALLDAGQRGSAHFRRLIDKLAGARVIVHITPASSLPPVPPGGLQFVAAAGGYRYLRIALRTELPPQQLIALLAHELQHAREIAEAPEVVNEVTLRQFYRVRGRRSCLRTPHECYETHAAKAAGLAVFLDLQGTHLVVD